MKKLRKLSALACAVLLGTAAHAEVKTYSFTGIATSDATVIPTYGESVTCGSTELQTLSFNGDDFDGRFAVGPKGRNDNANANGNSFIFYNHSGYEGLWTAYSDRNFSVLDLHTGDKVTLTISHNASTLKFVGGDAVVSGQTYTASADGSLDFVSTGGVYIEKVEIETVETGATVAGYGTYDFTGFTNNTFTASGTAAKDKVNKTDMNLLQLGTSTFDNRFAVSRAGTENASSAWVAKNYNTQKGLFTSYNDRYFTILDLKDGDLISIEWSTDDAGTLRFVDAPAIAGKAANDAVESGVTYAISTSEASVNVNLVASGDGTKTALYIKSVTIQKSIPLSISSTVKLGTILLPFTTTTLPEGVAAYQVTGVASEQLQLEEVTTLEHHKPYMLYAEEGAAGSFAGIPVQAAGTQFTDGLLTGTTEATTAPAGSYVLQNKSGDVAFFYVKEADRLNVPAYRAWLTTTSEVKSFRFPGNVATAITDAELQTVRRQQAIYNLAGQRVAGARKGIYIVNGKKVIF